MSETKNKGFDIWRFVQTILLVGILVIVLNQVLFSGQDSNDPWLSGANQSVVSNQQLRELGHSYYMENYGDGIDPSNVEARTRDYGCHTEIHIYRDGNLVLRLVYWNGEMIEI